LVWKKKNDNVIGGVADTAVEFRDALVGGVAQTFFGGESTCFGDAKLFEKSSTANVCMTSNSSHLMSKMTNTMQRQGSKLIHSINNAPHQQDEEDGDNDTPPWRALEPGQMAAYAWDSPHAKRANSKQQRRLLRVEFYDEATASWDDLKVR
jgi:hypothetical protein